jgi:hypothetical protein
MRKTAKTKGWTANRLSIETGLDRRTIAKLMAGHEPPYTLRDFVRALQAGGGGRTDFAAARLRKLVAEAQLAELELKERNKTVVRTSFVVPFFEELVVSVRNTVKNIDSIPYEKKVEITSEIKHRVDKDLLRLITAADSASNGEADNEANLP